MPAPPRVRFAPSPTGYLHVGGARTALFNWLYARSHGGSLVLRIEDTDRERSSDEMTQAILDGLRWLGLDWDEGPLHQADGVERHRGQARELLKRGLAYRSFETADEARVRREAATDAERRGTRDRDLPGDEAEQRAAAGEPHTLRFRVPEGETSWEDGVHGRIRFNHADIDDFVILRSDGTPVYNLAVVSDDLDSDITHVIRGDDHISNTPRQIMLYQALGVEPPVFVHLPMILGADGARLSKRHGAASVGEYAEQGILPQTLVNFLALLGWNPGDDTEIMEVSELISRFSVARVNKKSAVFDPAKLEWMNGKYLVSVPVDELMPLVAPHLVAAGLTSEAELAERAAWFRGLVELLRPRARRVADIADQARPYLAERVEYDAAAVAKLWKDPDAVAERLRAVHEALKVLEAWNAETLEGALRELTTRLEIGFGKLAQPLRLALTGEAVSPGIDRVLVMMGRDLALRRVADARAALEAQSGHG